MRLYRVDEGDWQPSIPVESFWVEKKKSCHGSRVAVSMYPRLMDFFGFETDFESFLARLFTTVRTVFGSRTTIRETILGGCCSRRLTCLMICLNAFQTTENDFNDVASLHQYTYIHHTRTYFNSIYLWCIVSVWSRRGLNPWGCYLQRRKVIGVASHSSDAKTDCRKRIMDEHGV